MWVPSLGQEDPREEGMATHSRIFSWRFPGTEEPNGLQFIESQRVGQTEATWHTHSTHIINSEDKYNVFFRVMSPSKLSRGCGVSEVC